jgi:curved DNA-binding protein CbpA
MTAVYAAKHRDGTDWDPKSFPKGDFDEDYYSVLEVDASIPQRQLKKAYYKMVFQYHPDNKETAADKERANKQMMVINSAYKVLKNPSLREQYDIRRQMGFVGGASKVREKAWKNEKKSETPYDKNDPYYKGAAAGSASTSTTSTSAKTAYGSSGSAGKADSSRRRDFRADSRTAGYSNNFYDARKDVEDDAAESEVGSFGDILSDIWNDLRYDGGKNLLEDMLDFLEDKIPAETSGTNYDAVIDMTANGKASADVTAEKTVLTTAIGSLNKHLQQIRKERDDAEAAVRANSKSNTQNSSSQSPEERVKMLELQLQRIENVKALSARITEVEKQVRKLRRQLDGLNSSRYSASKAGGNLSAGTAQRESYANASQAKDVRDRTTDEKVRMLKVDEELEFLKKRMKRSDS